MSRDKGNTQENPTGDPPTELAIQSRRYCYVDEVYFIFKK